MAILDFQYPANLTISVWVGGWWWVEENSELVCFSHQLN